MKLLKTINPENVSEEEVKDYRTREAGRALRESKAVSVEGSSYIVPRDLAFIEEAKNSL